MKDKYGHETRYSDSSLYDEVCVKCGATDAAGDKRLNEPCPKAAYAEKLYEHGSTCFKGTIS